MIRGKRTKSSQDAPQSSVTTDKLFAAAPLPLIENPRISHAAFRLWCVLLRLVWLKASPEIERLQQDMALWNADKGCPDPPTRRSIYRWLTELEAEGWLDWERTPGRANANRFVVLTDRKPVIVKSQGGSQPVTLGSQDSIDDHQPVIVESQPVTLGSQVVIVGSQANSIHPLPEPINDRHENHENHEIVGGVGGTPAIDLVAELVRREMNRTSAETIASRGHDAATILRFVDDMLAAGKQIGSIVNRLLLAPPKTGERYERRRTQPARSDTPTYRAKRSVASANNPDRDAEYDAQLRLWEQQAAARDRTE